MKNTTLFTATLFVCMLQFGAYSAMATDHHKYVSVEKAYNEKHIYLNISGNGCGYSGNTIKFAVYNPGKDSCFCSLEAGRRLGSDDTAIQDMLITQGQQMALAGNQTRYFTVYAFCCQMHHHSPQLHSKYNIGKMATGALLEIAKFFNRHSAYNTSVTQSAIWAVSDNDDLSQIANTEGTAALLDTITCIKVHYMLTVPYKKNKDTYYCKLKYNLPAASIVTINVYNHKGGKVMTYYERTDKPQDYDIPFLLNVKGWKKGKYSICVMSDNGILLKKKFEM